MNSSCLHTCPDISRQKQELWMLCVKPLRLHDR